MIGPLVRSALDRLRLRRAPAWSRVEQILADALDVPRPERRAFLDRECAGDPGLRAEVAGLLAASDASGPIDRPLDALLSPLLTADVETAEAPTRLIAHFELLSRVSAGGMGVVYRARDTRLQRIVALKFLPAALSSDAAAKSRFLLEARAAAALDHRNVCVIHEIGETADAQLFISMPFYEGETLADRLARGPIGLHEAMKIASQVAQGLAHAHERGLVHRDIKPGNLMLASDGVVKILDFGIVKWSGAGVTRTGVALGTLPYMSPERLRSEPTDARTDLWSLGVVLYEMLARRRPFDAADDHLLREAITFAPPSSLTALRPDVPEELSRLIYQLLAKSPDDRPPSAQAIVELLDGLQRHPAVAVPDTERRAGLKTAGDPVAQAAADTADVLPEGERRQATIVILSLSGYSDLVERRPSQEVDEVMRRLKRETWEIVERHGGTINEFSEERIVLVFGVPMSLEDHCLRATRAAIDLRAAMRAWRATSAATRGLALHTAIDTGEAAVQRLQASIVPYRIAGRPMRRAVQLCARARTDQILLAPDAGRAITAQFRLEAADPVSLADEAAPWRPFAVVEERAGLDRLDQLAGRDDLTEFAGRETELAALTQAFAEARRGAGQLVTISGEAGLGKSRLLHEFRRTVDAASAAVLIGRCSSYGQATAYMPFLQMLRGLLQLEAAPGEGWTDDDIAARVLRIDAALEPMLPYYLRLLSIPSERYRVATPERDDHARLALVEALVAMFVAAARARPVVLLLEDWHWADAASHETLSRLAAFVSTGELLAVVTTRSTLEWSNAVPHRAIALRALPHGSSAALLRSVLAADDIPAELVSRVHERTGGNPFFLEEIGRSLLEAGTVRIEARRARLEGSLDALQMPANVQAVIRTRLDRLALDVRQVLRAAAVVGRDFTREILVSVLANPARVDPALDALSAAGIVRQTAVLPDHAYQFAHALVQEAAYAGLLEHQRADLHARVAHALEELHAAQLDDWLDRLAQHFSLAENWPKAVHYGLAAASRTQGLYRYVDALRLLDRTRDWIAMLDGEQRRIAAIDILFRQERLCDLLGSRDRQRQIADELVTMLESEGDPVRLADAYLHKGELHTILGEFEQAEAALEASLRLRRETGDALGERASLRGLGFLRWWQRRYDDALACNAAALAIDRTHQRLNAIVGDLHNLGTVYSVMRNVEAARACFEEALALSEPARGNCAPALIDLWEARVAVLYSFGNLLASTGDLDGALAYLGQDAEWACDSNHPQRAGHFFTAAADVRLKQGLIDECLADYRHAIEITRANHLSPQLGQSLQAYGDTLIALGREREALASLEEASRVYETLTDGPAEARAVSQMARAHERLGNIAEAQSAWQRARSVCREGRDLEGEIDALEGLGRVARRHLPAAVALRFYEEAIALATTLEDHERAARLHNSAGIVEWTRGHHASALAHFERALDLFETLGDRVAAGQMMNSVGVTLDALGRSADARVRLTQAIAHHVRMEQPQLEAHALAGLGDSFWAAGEAREAGLWYERSLHKRTAISDVRGEGWMLQRLARSRAALGERADADGLLTRAIGIAMQCSDEELMEECVRLRAALSS